MSGKIIKPMFDCSNIDWKELRQQKRHLSDILYKNGHTTPQQRDTLEGILNLLDCIQDKAALELGEETVFGRK